MKSDHFGRHNGFRSLQTRCALFTALIGAAFAAIAGLLTYRGMAQHSQHLVAARMSLAADLIEHSLKTSDSRAELAGTLHWLDEKDGVDLIVVVGGDPPQVIASTRNDLLGKSLEKLAGAEVGGDLQEAFATGRRAQRYHSHIDAYDLTIPLRLTGEHVTEGLPVDAAVMIHADARPIRTEAAADAWELFGVLLVLIGLVCLISVWSLRHFVFDPLAAICDIMNRHAAGDEDVSVNVRRLDEIGSVAQALNGMIRTVSDTKARLHTIVENAALGISVVDDQGRFVQTNPAFRQMIDRTDEELEGKRFTELTHAGDVAEAWARYQDLLEGKHPTYRMELRYHRKDGAVQWASVSVSKLLQKNGPQLALGMLENITERHVREEELKKLKRAVEQSPAMVLITDTQGNIEYVNPKFTEVTGYTAAEVLRKNPRILKSGKQDADFYREMWETITAGHDWHGEFCNRKKNGTLYWEAASVSAVRNEQNEIVNFVAVKEDITDKVRDQEQLRLQGSALAAAANSIFITNRQGQITWANDAFCRMSGFGIDELINQTPRILKSGQHDAAFYKQLWDVILSGHVWSGEVVERHKNGEHYTVQQTITPLIDGESEITHFIAVHEDITARKGAEARIEQMAYHDSLTGLSNRAELQNRLDQAVQQAVRHSRSLALHFIDLDRFKVVNDTLGHSVGDMLLQAVAQRLKSCVRASDTAARIGGDEFAILQPEIANVDAAASLARKIIGVMADPFRLSGRDLHISPSIGVSVFPLDSQGPEELLKNADMAMYLAKKEGRNNFQFFTSGLNEQIRDRLALEADLHAAFDKGEFVLYFQPQVDLRTRRLSGVEALIRWQHPTRGLVGPSLFVGVAEECGLIDRLTRWVLEQACFQNAAWHAAGLPRLRIAVNVSAANFKHGDLCQVIADALKRTQLPPHYLELEVTETVLLQDEHVVNAIPLLKKMGVMLSIDDFGTGYSSLNYLRRLPVEKLKIDKSFVLGLPDSQDDAIIAKAIIDLGHALGHTVIAEGVESKKQLLHLRDHGCDEGQGYFFARPMPAESFTALLHQEQSSIVSGLRVSALDQVAASTFNDSLLPHP